MKMIIDKEYTTLALAGQVKQDMQEFRARYTDNDLHMFFLDAIPEYRENCGYCGDIIKSTVTAFPGGDYYNNETHFHVELMIEQYNAIYKISYYCNLEMEIHLETSFGDKMYQIRKFVEA